MVDFKESPARNAFEKEFYKILSTKENWREVLDIGCSSRYYKSKIPHLNYTGFDLPSNEKADVKGDAHNIPLEDGKFDTALALQIFYTLENPKKALLEMKRILKPNGTLIATFNFHMPRVGKINETKNVFTEYRVKQMFEGFKNVKIIPVKGFLTQLGQNWFRWTNERNGFLRRLFFFIRWLAVLLTLIDKPNPKYAVLFLVIAKK